MLKKRKWNDDYVRFGFTCIEKTEDLQKPQGILCETVFSNANLKPSKLKNTSTTDMTGRMFWAMMKNICGLKERVLIPSNVSKIRFCIC